MYNLNESKDNQHQYAIEPTQPTSANFSLPPPSYVIADEQGCTGWCERQQKHKPQSNSVAAGKYCGVF